MPQFDFKLTKADFAGESWESSLATCGEPTCSSFCVVFNAKIDEAKSKNDEKGERVYRLLHAASSLHLELGTPQQPFRPAVILEKVRSAAVEDFGETDGAVLNEIAAGIQDSEFRSRIADLLWVIRRDFRMARLAIPGYVESAKRLEQLPQTRSFVERFHRAVQLAMMVGKGDSSLLKGATDEIERTITKRSPSELKWTCADLMHVLVQAGAGDPAKLAAVAESIALRAEAKEDWTVARVYWQRKAEWHRLANQSEEHRLALVRAAETYVGEGESALKRQTPSHGACAGNFMRAVEALRRLPGTKERVDQLHARIIKEQELSTTEATTHTVETDISGMVRATIELFKGKDKKEVLLGLALFGDWPKKEGLHEQAKSTMKESVWGQIFPTVFTTSTGKHLAQKPGGVFQTEDEIEVGLKAQMMQELEWHRGLLVDGGIKPALQVINSEHFLVREDLLFLVENNPFIPPGHEGLFLRGLHAGITGDLLVALHLLIPQIENSIRYVLSQYANEPRTSKLKDDLTQPERELNELLYREDVEQVLGPDLVFSLRALLIEPGFGANLRNNLAHGLMTTDRFVDSDAVYAWWLVWKICCMPLLVQLQRNRETSAESPEPQPGEPTNAPPSPE